MGDGLNDLTLDLITLQLQKVLMLLLNTRFFILSVLSCLLDSSWAGMYFTYQEGYYLSNYFSCHGTPKLQSQRVQYIEEATSTYYSTLMAGRFSEDKNLDLSVPPSSIISSPVYLEILQMAMDASSDQYPTQLYMLLGCHLYNQQEWVNDVYNGPLSRNTDTFRAILDILYRLMLCIKDIDADLNCPDVCRARPEDDCQKTANAIGTCSTYEEDIIAKTPPEYLVDVYMLKKKLKAWLRLIPSARRLPIDFFWHKIEDADLFTRKIMVQRLVARTAFCPCKVYFTVGYPEFDLKLFDIIMYDRTLKGCVDESEETICGGANPCANGGNCLQIALPNVKKDNFITEFRCICPPAFGGDTCEGEINRCTTDSVCGEYPCVRDPYELNNGYRCICPNTHKPKDAGDPRCVPQPACGERVERFHLGDPGDVDQPCLNNGQCLQDENNPADYTCLCPKGFSGNNCEILPPPAVWSTWSTWSDCIWPEPQEICYKRGYQERTRICIIQSIMQRCIGPQRIQRYAPCDLAIVRL